MRFKLLQIISVENSKQTSTYTKASLTCVTYELGALM